MPQALLDYYDKILLTRPSLHLPKGFTLNVMDYFCDLLNAQDARTAEIKGEKPDRYKA
jgi:hypothetical protein